MNREELLRHCNPAAVYGARRVVIAEGRGRGQRLIEVKTAGGMRASFLEDKCLDILDFEYKGVNLAFLSKNGLTDVRHTEADGFLKYWAGGFLATCGLRNVGEPCTVGKEFFPFHGRIGLTPAERVNVKVNEEKITITGTVKETTLFGNALEFERKITIPSDGARIEVKDRVHNLCPEEEYVFLLYHINFGYPFLNEGLQVDFPEAEIRGRTPAAQEVIGERLNFTKAMDGIAEHVFFYDTEEERPAVKLHNPHLGISAKIEYKRDQLPVLAQWKCLRSGDYALGIEPSTSYIRGRAEELEQGYNTKVPGFGTLKFGFTIELSEEAV